jgi:hypothetical protein
MQVFLMFQLSNGGAAFMAGKGIKNDKQKAAILGPILHNSISAEKLSDAFSSSNFRQKI